MLGVSEDQLSSAVRRGWLRRLAFGLYAVGPESEDAAERHRELCRGALLLYPDGVLAGHSAVVARDLPTFGVPLGTALVKRPVTRQVRRSGVIVRPRTATAATVTTSTGPADEIGVALVQLSLDHGTVAGVVSADAALASGAVTESELEAEVAARHGHPRSQRAKAMLSLVDGRSESPGESRTRVVLASIGLPVVSQVVIRDGHRIVARADLGIEGTNVLIEFDGLVKYRDGGADALIAEKRREDRLRALGYTVVRVTWADLEHPARLIAMVRAAVARDMATRHPTA